MTQTVDRRGYGLVELRSRGDLRFRPRRRPPGFAAIRRFSSAGAMLASGDLAAQRIYPRVPPASRWPASGMRIPLTRARIAGNACGSGPSAVTPLSAFGRLALAPTVEQGGVLYAPLGAIQLGSTAPTSIAVAAAAAGQPDVRQRQGRDDTYGGTVDGLSYLQRRDRRAWLGGGKNGIGNMEHGVVLTGRSFSVDPGAVIDVSGGGTLAARHSSADEAVPRIPCTTRCPGSTRHRAIRTADAGRPPGLCHPARVADRRYAPLAPRDAPPATRIPAVARRNHHHRRGRARSGGGHLYAAPRVLRAPCPALSACVELGRMRSRSRLSACARRILDGDGDARAGRHRAPATAGPSGADHAGRRALRRHAQATRWTTRPTPLGGRHAQGAACVVASGCLCARTAILGRMRRRDGAPGFEGAMRANRGAQGYGGQVIVRADQPLEIVKDGATPGFLGASVRAADINALGADRISIGGSTAQSSISPDRLRFDARGDISTCAAERCCELLKSC